MTASWAARLLLFELYRCERCKHRFLLWKPRRLFVKLLRRSKVPSQLESFQSKAEHGCPEAQYVLALMYAEGREVEQSPRLAKQWLLRASEQGVVEARLRLGELYESDGALQNCEEAMRWYRLAADAGHVEAKQRLAGLRVRRYGFSEDAHARPVALLPEAGTGLDFKGEDFVARLRPAAEEGIIEAQYRLGQWCRNSGNLVEANTWLRRAAVGGHGEAQFALAYLQSGSEDENEHKEAFGWLTRAAQSGVAEAQHTLGSLYESGEGVSRDMEAAVEWYRRAGLPASLEAVERLRRTKKNAH